MPRTPLVSIITIFFNEERFLAEAVESVLAQSFEDWELLLVDDGSTDGSTALAKQFAARDPERIRYLSHPDHGNRGMAASRNAGLAAASGTLVAFLDADDAWLPNRLEAQLAEARANPDAELICGASIYWSSWQEGGKDFVVEMGGRHDVVLDPPELSTAVHPLGQGAAPCVSALLVKREAFERLGGFVEDFRGFYEDQTFLAKAYLGCRILVRSTVCDRYRQHPDSCSASAAADGTDKLRRLDFLVWLERYLDDRKIADRNVRDALERELDALRNPLASAVKRRVVRLLGALR